MSKSHCSSHTSCINSSRHAHSAHHGFHQLPIRPVAAFRAYRQFNQQDMSWLSQMKTKATYHADQLFTSDRMPDKVARLLCQERVLNVKELLESFEFFQRVRHRISHTHVADLCCGHGMVGILFALLERKVEHVYLLDVKFPESSQAIVDILNQHFPWVKDKIHYIQRSVKNAWQALPPSCNCVAVHACGIRSDWALQTAVHLQSHLAVMPCCYASKNYRAPKVIKQQLGTELSMDIARTYFLEQQGYQVAWQEIPVCITVMNRIISASYI